MNTESNSTFKCSEYGQNLKGYSSFYKPAHRSIIKNTVYRRVLFFFVGLLLWAVFVIPCFFAYKKSGSDASSPVELGQDVHSLDRIDISINIIDLDLNTRKGSFFVQLKPVGQYKLNNNSLSTKVIAQWNFQNKVFPKNEPMASFTMTIPFMTGTITDYPFDAFHTSMPTTLVNENNDKIPRKLSIVGFSQSFKILFDYKDNNGVLELLIGVKRTNTTIVISMFVNLLMWALSISILNIAWDILIRNREIIPGIMSVGVSMMFALPALRNTQPGIPGTGCLSDIIGYFWNMIIIAISAVAIIYTWALRWKYE